MKPAWFIGAAAVVGFLLWRRRKLEPTLLVVGGLVAAGMVVYGTGAIHFPNLDHILTTVGTTLGVWTYALVGVMAYAETGAFIGLIAPGETVILIGGVVAGQGKINLVALIAIVWSCAVAGDLTSFWLGHRFGRDFLIHHGQRVHITEERVEQVERFFARRGGQSILIGRFVGLVRAIAPFLAGSSDMSVRQFLAYDVIGAGLWGSTFAVLGFVFWNSLNKVLDIAKKGSLILAVVIVVIVGIVAAVKWLRDPDNREKLDEVRERAAANPAVKPFIAAGTPIARWSRRPARFMVERVTPGDLGLEVTALVSTVAAALFVFVGYLSVVHRGTITFGDRRGVQWAMDVAAPWLTDLNKALTTLGTLEVTVPVLVIAVIALLWWHRRWPEALALVVGFWVTWGVTQGVKHAVHRHRPPHALVSTSGWAFPSGHTANAVVWLAIGVALWRLLDHIWARTAVIVVGAALTATVGLTRIYLRVHWWSDVAAAWALGIAVYGVCGIAAVVVAERRGAGRAAKRQDRSERDAVVVAEASRLRG